MTPSASLRERDKAAAAAAHLRILMVEDNEADAYLIGRALADNPLVATVTHARDGDDALAMVDRGDIIPDLALIDLHMPRVNGFDLLVAFANRRELSFPMVVLTSSSAPSDAIRSRLRSAARVVIKPDTVAELCAVLNSVVEATCHPRAGRLTERPAKGQDYLLAKSHRTSIRRQDGAEASD